MICMKDVDPGIKCEQCFLLESCIDKLEKSLIKCKEKKDEVSI